MSINFSILFLFSFYFHFIYLFIYFFIFIYIMYYCYILYSTNSLFPNRTYIGMSNDPINRLYQHNNTK